MEHDPVPGAENGTKKKSWRERLTSKMPRVKIDKRKAGHYAKRTGQTLAFSAMGVCGAIAFMAWPIRTAFVTGGLLGVGKALEESAEIEEAKEEVATAAAAGA